MKKIIAANLISGLSLIFLVVFGVNYLIFKNTPVYTDYTIEIINNPITGDSDIQFAMSGKKNLDCTANNVHGIAVRGGDSITLDNYTQGYKRNIAVGEFVTNQWAYARPKGLHPGVWHVTMQADWTCRLWIFQETSQRSYDNILLVVK